MSLRALDGISPEWYTLPGDEDEAEGEKCEFRIFPLTGPQLLEVNQHFNEEDLSISGTGLLLAFKMGVRDWRGVYDRKGEPMKYSKLAIDLIPPVALAQVGGRIIRMSTMTEEDLGN